MSFVYCVPLSPVSGTVSATWQAHNTYLLKELMNPILKYLLWLPVTFKIEVAI